VRIGDPISSTEVLSTLWVVWLYPRGTQPGKWWLLGWSWVLKSWGISEWNIQLNDLKQHVGLSQLEGTFSFLFILPYFPLDIYLLLNLRLLGGCDSFKDVIRKMKSKAKPPNLRWGKDVLISLTKKFFLIREPQNLFGNAHTQGLDCSHQ